MLSGARVLEKGFYVGGQYCVEKIFLRLAPLVAMAGHGGKPRKWCQRQARSVLLSTNPIRPLASQSARLVKEDPITARCTDHIGSKYATQPKGMAVSGTTQGVSDSSQPALTDIIALPIVSRSCSSLFEFLFSNQC
jgi:hypothetical protein